MSFSELVVSSDLSARTESKELDETVPMELALTSEPALVAETPEKAQDNQVVIQPTNKKGKRNAAPATKDTRKL